METDEVFIRGVEVTWRIRWTVLAATLLWACTSSPPSVASVPVPSPCVGNDTVYTSADVGSGRDLHLASPRTTILPPQTFHGRAVLHLLVNASGHVVPDSTRITGVSFREDSLSLARRANAYQFYPAMLGACAVASWTSIEVTRQ